MWQQDGPLCTPLSGFTTLTLIRLQVLRPCVVGSLLDQVGSVFSLACLVYRSQSVNSFSRSVELAYDRKRLGLLA